MPAVQSSYTEYQPVAFVGMIANTEPNNIISREVEGAAIGFGVAVQTGTDDRQVTAATAADDVPVGITVRTASNATSDGTVVDEYPVGTTAPILTRGVIWVTAGADVTAVGVPAYMVVGTAEAGNFTPTATANLDIDATFESTGTQGSLVKIRLGR